VSRRCRQIRASMASTRSSSAQLQRSPSPPAVGRNAKLRRFVHPTALWEFTSCTRCLHLCSCGRRPFTEQECGTEASNQVASFWAAEALFGEFQTAQGRLDITQLTICVVRCHRGVFQSVNRRISRLPTSRERGTNNSIVPQALPVNADTAQDMDCTATAGFYLTAASVRVH
jgi:hypothetical protein